MGCGTSFVKYVLFFFNLVVAILTALNFYARGSYQGSVGQNMDGPMAQQTVSRCLKEVTTALNAPHILRKHIRFPQNRNERNFIKQKFYEKYGLPGVVGCIDCTHVAIVRPSEHEEQYFNRKHFHSINTQVLLGLLVVGIGVAFLVNWRTVKDELQAHLTVAPWVFIVIGAIMFVIAFFGCCGAIRESHCMVVTYAIFLLVIIIMQVILAVLLFVYGDTLKNSLEKGVDGLWNKRTHDGAASEVFNNIQAQLKCCGDSGPGDYYDVVLDKSCCDPNSFGSQTVGCTIATAYPGCRKVVGDLYEKWNKPIAGVAIGVACIEVVGALFALCLANSIRNMDRRSHF